MAETPFDILGRELLGAAQRQIAAPVSRPRRSRRALLLAATVTVLVLAAASWAATQLVSVGSPVPYHLGRPVNGRVVPGSIKLLTTVPDPAGGLPWGLRSFATARGFACAQVGRVLRGRIGYLDGDVFHELRPGTVPNPNDCIPLDGADHAFISVHFAALASSGSPATCPANASTPCPDADLRTVDYGLLGPRATAIAYRAGGAAATTTPVGAEGGYLIVQKEQQHVRTVAPFTMHDVDLYLVGYRPQPPVLTAVTYGATTCPASLTHQAHHGACTYPPGFVPIPQPTVADVSSAVTATAISHNTIRVRFRARRAVTNERSAYTIHAGSQTFVLDHNVRAGTTITENVLVPALGRRGPRRYLITVAYRGQARFPSPGGAVNLSYPGAIVGRAAVTVP